MSPITDARNAITKALDALAKTAPHPRDYYVQDRGDEEFERARCAHQLRMQRLTQVGDELQAIGIAILDQDYAQNHRGKLSCP